MVLTTSRSPDYFHGSALRFVSATIVFLGKYLGAWLWTAFVAWRIDTWSVVGCSPRWIHHYCIIQIPIAQLTRVLFIWWHELLCMTGWKHEQRVGVDTAYHTILTPISTFSQSSSPCLHAEEIGTWDLAGNLPYGAFPPKAGRSIWREVSALALHLAGERYGGNSAQWAMSHAMRWACYSINQVSLRHIDFCTIPT